MGTSKEKLYCEVEPYKLKKTQRLYVGIKTVVDFFVALIALSVMSPLFIIIPIAIKIDSKGPVFFVQERIGKNGKLFKCIKFRSMFVDANHHIAGYQYKEVEEEITRVGHFLRKTSLDELPQFLSLLTGKMSLIGYRPSQENETELNTAREGFNLYQIKPGITGWAQVNGRDILAAHPTLKAKYDGYYMKHISLWLDIKISFMTFTKVIRHSDVEEGVFEDEALATTNVVVDVNKEKKEVAIGK